MFISASALLVLALVEPQFGAKQGVSQTLAAVAHFQLIADQVAGIQEHLTRQDAALLRLSSGASLMPSSSLAGSYVPGPQNASRTRTVLIGQSASRVGWMYAPVRNTIVAGFKSRADRYGYQVKVVMGDESEVNTKHEPAVNQLKAGDVWVWIGVAGLKVVKEKLGRQAAAQGVYMILYQTEPCNGYGCGAADGRAGIGTCRYVLDVLRFFNEVWDYSKSNVNSRCTTATSTVVYRYVPPGYNALSHTQKAGRASLDAQIKTGKLVAWMGGDRCKPKFKNEWLKEQWLQVDTIWTSGAFDKFMNQHTVFGNVHKECDSSNHTSVEAVRISQLMSTGPNVVVSELAYQDDMDDFQGNDETVKVVF